MEAEKTVPYRLHKIRARAGAKGGRSTAARYGGSEMARRVREAQIRKFEGVVDPDGLLSAADRRVRADAARRQHLSEIASKPRKIAAR